MAKIFMNKNYIRVEITVIPCCFRLGAGYGGGSDSNVRDGSFLLYL